MAVCIGFVRSQFSTSAWTRCARPAVRRGRLCQEHREGFEGAVLGMLEIEVIRRSDLVRKLLRPKKGVVRRHSPGWDARNAAAATTTHERLEPDPARARPAPTLPNEIGALVLGALLSVHHAAIAAAFLGGAAAFYIGEQIRTLA